MKRSVAIGLFSLLVWLALATYLTWKTGSPREAATVASIAMVIALVGAGLAGYVGVVIPDPQKHFDTPDPK